MDQFQKTSVVLVEFHIFKLPLFVLVLEVFNFLGHTRKISKFRKATIGCSCKDFNNLLTCQGITTGMRREVMVSIKKRKRFDGIRMWRTDRSRRADLCVALPLGTSMRHEKCLENVRSSIS